MAALKVFVAGILLVVASPAYANVAHWQPHIAEASQRFGVPESWIKRVMRAESGGRLMLGGKPIRSSAGAMGLMQLMPATWGQMRAALALGRNPDDPRDNILAGTYYLRLMYDRFGYPGCFAAYNAGPARYAAYLTGRARLPAETIAYVKATSGGAVSTQENAPNHAPEPLFVTWKSPLDDGSSAQLSAPTSPLFAIRK